MHMFICPQQAWKCHCKYVKYRLQGELVQIQMYSSGVAEKFYFV